MGRVIIPISENITNINSIICSLLFFFFLMKSKCETNVRFLFHYECPGHGIGGHRHNCIFRVVLFFMVQLFLKSVATL
jgi:hypothetical protein